MNTTAEAIRKPKPWEYSAAQTARPKAKVAKPPTPPQILELLLRHHLGFMDNRVHERLSMLFKNPPADIDERLARACEHLSVSGANAEVYALAAGYQEAITRLTVRLEADAWVIGNIATLEDYLARANKGDPQALLAVVAYIELPEVSHALGYDPIAIYLKKGEA